MPISKDIQNRLAEEYIGTVQSSDAQKLLRKNKSKFGIDVYQYPSDLGSEELQHYIEFQINVRGKSELDKNKQLFQVQRNPNSANLSQEDISKAAHGLGVISGAAIGAGISKTIYNLVGKSGSKSKSNTNSEEDKNKFLTGENIATTTGGLAGAYIANKAMNANELLKPDTTYRISDVIALYVDGPPTVKYGMNYANKDLGTLAGLSNLIKGSVEDTLQSVKNAGGEASAAIFANFAKLPGAFGLPDVQTLISSSSKTSLNPFREVIFESVDFRSFGFKYKFLPKNKNESEMVKNIIRLFKYHMHPELSKNKLFFIYPSEFQISYYFKDKKNTYFHKLAPCALESMEVSYGGEQFSSFRDGNPTEVNMSLTFRELEILTKNMINEGY